MRSIDYTNTAITDLTQIWLQVAETIGVPRADEIRAKIEECLARIIARHSGAGRVRPEFGPGVRSFPVNRPYVAFYRHSGDRAKILRVLHGHRDIREPLTSLLAAV